MGELYGAKMRVRKVTREKLLTAEFAKNAAKNAKKRIS